MCFVLYLSMLFILYSSHIFCVMILNFFFFFQPEEVQFFAGNTVYMKVSRYWHEVPKEEYEPLKIKILNLIAQYSNSKVVLNRLVKSVSKTASLECCSDLCNLVISESEKHI